MSAEEVLCASYTGSEPPDLVMVTGSRGWPDPWRVWLWAYHLPLGVRLIEGECPDSPDVYAAWGFMADPRRDPSDLWKRPADWDTYGKRAGISRNTDMVKEMVRYRSERGWRVEVHAFWDGESTGTNHAMRQARARAVPLITHKPLPYNFSA